MLQHSKYFKRIKCQVAAIIRKSFFFFNYLLALKAGLHFMGFFYGYYIHLHFSMAMGYTFDRIDKNLS